MFEYIYSDWNTGFLAGNLSGSIRYRLASNSITRLEAMHCSHHPLVTRGLIIH
ncbi:hypothetical protein [Agarivorans sp. 1_MG-2023]|uniref:hypothetical protein n=1 Tax=Agarivorans sp. 1_MG-2023 TaxID=3062634 RepID=UPI0026E196BC|nr:hypothetical protein [Agarivorans sp. 1_MG-2023]MDO6765954.1 hypothetical protein [Agarivorans sp. 1_MG-2023]